MNLLDLFLLTLVGAFWGCTNPFLRQGASNVTKREEQKESADDAKEKTGTSTSKRSSTAAPSTLASSSLANVLQASITKFGNVRVWLPYALNQFGSVLFYLVLSRSDLMLAVPICNGLSLVFSVATSISLGERVDKPLQAMVGSALVMIGVGICLQSRESDASEE